MFRYPHEEIHMSNEKLSEEEIKEVFEKLNIHMESKKRDDMVEIWQVPPIRKGSRIFSKTY